MSRFRSSRQSASTTLVGVVVLLSVLATGCGISDLIGPGYGEQREDYLLALAEGDGATAWSLLCPAAQELFPTRDELMAAFTEQVEELDLIDTPSSWASLRGDDKRAGTTFMQHSDEQVTLILPVHYDSGEHATMCPTSRNVLGEPQ